VFSTYFPIYVSQHYTFVIFVCAFVRAFDKVRDPQGIDFELSRLSEMRFVFVVLFRSWILHVPFIDPHLSSRTATVAVNAFRGTVLIQSRGLIKAPCTDALFPCDATAFYSFSSFGFLAHLSSRRSSPFIAKMSSLVAWQKQSSSLQP
jgi:hypothetical protein